MSDSESVTGVPLREPLSPSTTPEPQAAAAAATAARQATKRKRDSEEPEFEDSDAAAKSAIKRAKKLKKKAKKSKAPKDISEEALDAEAGVNHAIAHMDPQLLADHIAQRIKRFEGEKLSLVELEDLRVPATAILDSTSWIKPRDLSTLPTFLEAFSKPRRGATRKGPKLSDSLEEAGAPHTLFLTSSGIRAADLTRALRPFQTKNSLVAKLFAKHIKLKEALETVRKSRMGIGVGTPQRVSDLLDAGVLKTEGLERVVVDASFIDAKKRGVLDMKDTVGVLVKVLCRPELKERYAAEGKEKVELLFY